MKMILVEEVETFLFRYVIEVHEGVANPVCHTEGLQEFSSDYLSTVRISQRQIDVDEMLRLHRESENSTSTPTILQAKL
jgi:hypothetical protein|tara:strand:+ start:1793 stop:2029 length:237 start_codon:yes stop_codon:yes gene_type:complete